MKLLNLFESNTLVGELIWWQKYITEHDLDIQFDLNLDKLVVYHNNVLIGNWTASKSKSIRTDALSFPGKAFSYAVNNKQWRVFLEPIIATDAMESFYYARDSLNGLFELGEPAIASDSSYAFQYARFLKRPFKLGEPVIAASADFSVSYAKDVLNGRFELGEPVIATDAKASYEYADFLKQRFELGEPIIATNTIYSYRYKLFLQRIFHEEH